MDGDTMSVLLMSLSVLAALIAAVVAWKQYRIAQIASRMSVFGRRMAVHDGVMSFVAEFVRSGEVSDNSLTSLLQSTRESKFLFGDEVVEYILRVHGVASELAGFNRMQFSQDVGTLEKRIELVNWMSSQFDEIDKVFRPYLQYRER